MGGAAHAEPEVVFEGTNLIVEAANPGYLLAMKLTAALADGSAAAHHDQLKALFRGVGAGVFGCVGWGSGVEVFAHVDGLDPVGDLFDLVVVGEGGDDVSSVGWACWGPWCPAVGDDDDGVGFGFGGGCDHAEEHLRWRPLRPVTTTMPAPKTCRGLWLTETNHRDCAACYQQPYCVQVVLMSARIPASVLCSKSMSSLISSLL